MPNFIPLTAQQTILTLFSALSMLEISKNQVKYTQLTETITLYKFRARNRMTRRLAHTIFLCHQIFSHLSVTKKRDEVVIISTDKKIKLKLHEHSMTQKNISVAYG